MATITYDTEDVLPQLLKSGAYSDLTIRCGDSAFLVHKSVVCMQSGHFKTACEEAKWKEGSTGVIMMKASNDVTEGDDPYAVSLMITFLYENDYQPRLLQTTSLLDEHEDDGDPGFEIEAQVSKSTNNEALVDYDQDEMWMSSKNGKQ